MDDQKAEQDAPEPQDEQAPEVTPEEQPAAEAPEPEAVSATEAAERAEEGAEEESTTEDTESAEAAEEGAEEEAESTTEDTEGTEAEQGAEEEATTEDTEGTEAEEGAEEEATTEDTEGAEAAEEGEPEAEATTEGEEAGEEAEEEEGDKLPAIETSVDETGPCGRLVRVLVPGVRVTAQIDEAYEELRRTVFIKGFRKGHVPRHVLERRFGEDVSAGVKEQLVEEGFQAAVEEHGLDLAVPPDIDPEAVEMTAGESLGFEVSVEVVPEFTLDNYKGLAVQRPALAVGEGDVDRHIEATRMRQGEFKTVEDAAIGETDVPVVHMAVLVDGEEAWRRDELGAHIGDETVGGLPVPGLRDAFLGATAGESRTLKVTLPAEFPEEELAGKEVDLEITVDEVRRFEAPEATDEWAQGMDFEDLEDFREEVEDELRAARERDADEAVRTAIDDRLLELTSFDVPDGLVQRMVDHAMERQRLALLYRGVAEEQIEELVAGEAQRTREGSVRECKLYFIYRLIAEQEKLFVTESEIEQRVQAIALNYGRRPDEVRAELEESGRLGSLRQQMREEKVRDFLVQHAEVQDAEPAADETEEPDTPQPEAEAEAPEPPAGDEDNAADPQ